MQPQIYSYSRFSSPEQSHGDSERRQTERAEAFARDRNLPLDKSLRLTDRGLSGFHGANRKRGAFKAFLELVEADRVAPGSILLVENIDRLGREPVMQALETLTGIINRGIVIQTLSPERKYDREELNTGRIWELIAHIERAHAESKRKSDFSQTNWKQKRERARDELRIQTKRCPNWMRWLPNKPTGTQSRASDGHFELIPAAAKTVRMIFNLKLKGVSTRAITIKLNEIAPWRPRNGWQQSYVIKILSNRAVIGEYVPHQRTSGKRVPIADPIPGYYPAVVKPETFFAVQQQFVANRNHGGRRDRCNNLFTHLVKCAYCGGAMRFIDKGEPPKGQQYLQCDTAYRGLGCSRHSVRYDETEQVILQNCPRLRPEDVLPNPDDQAKKCDVIRRRLRGTDGELADIERQLENLAERVGGAPSEAIASRIYSRMETLERRKKTANAQRADDERALTQAEQGLRSFKAWQRNLADLGESLERSVETRAKMQHHLRELISKVEIYAVGYQHVRGEIATRDDGEELADQFYEIISDLFPKKTRDKTVREFIRYVQDRRMSKEGRFLRIHFTTGKTIDLVPAGSIGTGFELVRDRDGSTKDGYGKKAFAWNRIEPELQRMWDEFQTGKRHGSSPRTASSKSR